MTICIYNVIEKVIFKTKQKLPNYNYTKLKTFNYKCNYTKIVINYKLLNYIL